MSVDAGLKKFIGSQMKKYLKKARVKQIYLAEAMGISSSAVSQMLSGKILPTVEQMDIFLEKVPLDEETSQRLRDCVGRLRSGETELRSTLNEFIREARLSRGITMEQLSFMSGIPVATLDTLENRFTAQPTPYEAARLAAVLGCSAKDLWKTVAGNSEMIGPSDGGRAFRESYEPYEVTPQGQYQPQMPYQTQVPVQQPVQPQVQYQPPVQPLTAKVPVINFYDLEQFDRNTDSLSSFAWRHMIETETGHPADTVVVKASGEEFGWSNLYTLKMEAFDSPAWIPGMIVIACWDDNIILARATEETSRVIPLGEVDSLFCQWYWPIGGFHLTSGLFDHMDKFKRKDILPKNILYNKRRHFPEQASDEENKWNR